MYFSRGNTCYKSLNLCYYAHCLAGICMFSKSIDLEFSSIDFFSLEIQEKIIKYLQAEVDDFADNFWTFWYFFFRFQHLTAGVSLACFIEIQWLKNWAEKFPCMVHMVQRFSRMIIVAVNYDETLSSLLMIKLLII